MSSTLRRAAYIAAATTTLAAAAACSQDDVVSDDTDDVTGNGGGGGGADGPYEDGTYDASAEYPDGNGNPTSIDVELTVEDDVVTAVTVTPGAADGTSLQYQNRFAGGIDDEVVGEDLADLEVGPVSGSSLTPGGFNDAVAQIQDEASS